MYRGILAVLVLLGQNAFSQDIENQPYSSVNYLVGIENTATYEADALDVEALFVEDGKSKDGRMPRAGVIKPADLNLTNSGTWFDLPNGDKIWRLIMTVPNAIAVNLYFNDFYLPDGARLYAFSPGYREIAANYTADNNPESGYYATEYVHGQTIILEYYEPQTMFGVGRVSIEGINGFYDMIPPLEEEDRSGTCQVDVNCSEGDNWKKQRDATVRIIVKNNGQTGFCSGVLVNNTAEDCTPYILSAHHCAVDDNDIGSNQNDFDQWVFYFDYQKSGCGTGFATGFYTEVGAEKKANSHTNGGILGSDYILLELHDELDETKAPYFAGWNANNPPSNSGVSIHHPDGDFKKISTYNAALTSSNWFSSPIGSHWRVTWVGTANGHGVSEGGSSGSAIYNEEGQVVGQLSGGLSECNDTQPGGQNESDLYGKMSYNWSGSGNIQSLKQFLDPIGNGTTKTMHGNYYLCSQGSGAVNGIEDNVAKKAIKVYPNPAINNITIDLFDMENVDVEVYSALGQLVTSFKNQSNKVNISLDSINSGIYYISVRKDSMVYTRKMVKL